MANQEQFKDVRKVKKPKAPKLSASASTWRKFKAKYKEWEDYQKELEKRRKYK